MNWRQILSNIYSEFMILKLIKLLFCIYWEKSYHFLFQSVKVMHYIDILIFLILKQHHILGLWFLLQCIFILTYCSDDIANILWKIRDGPVILILPTLLVRLLYQCYAIYMNRLRECISLFYSLEESPWTWTHFFPGYFI